MSRRQKEPTSARLLRFIADHESLQITCDEFPSVSEERLRELILEAADGLERAAEPPRRAAPRPTRDARKKITAFHEIFSDGASRGNPGLAGAGWVIRAPDGELLEEGRAFLGKKTNNEAEYEALIRSLHAAAALGARDVLLKSDSELLVRQINGQYRIRNERLQHLHRTAREVIQGFHRFEARHVPREQNQQADALANRAIDEG